MPQDLPIVRKNASPILISFGALLLLALIILGIRFFITPTPREVLPLSVIPESAMIDGTRENEVTATGTPLSIEALAVVTTQTGAPIPLPPASFPGDGFIHTFPIEGVIEEINSAKGFLMVKDATTESVLMIAVNAATKITRGGEQFTFAELKIAHIIHVTLENGHSPLFWDALSIDVIGAMPMPLL